MNRTLNSTLRLTLVALITLVVALPATADDRRLISGFEEIPTVFFLFDTSGSMHWSAQCTQADFDAGECDYLCPTGDCWVPGNGDSPNSKFYQAKEAIYQVLDQTENINVGFATFNQDSLRAARKHWVYEALDDGPNIPGWGPYPRGRSGTTAGDWRIFGDSWSCLSGTGPDPDDDNTGCQGNVPADLSDQWERDRVAAWPSETPDFNGDADKTTTTFVRHAGETWKIELTVRENDPHTLGAATIRARFKRSRCADATCGSVDMSVSATVDYALVSDYLSWDFNTRRGPAQAGFFAQGTASDGPASNTCSGFDPNTDTTADTFDGTNIRWPTVSDPTFSPLMDVGDVLPIDWRTDNKQALLERLAPNLALGESVPDFRVATYFQDVIVPTDELKLKDQLARPILSFGATPLGRSLHDFHNFVSGPTGWVSVASLNDPSYVCRKTYLIVLSDGNQSVPDPPNNNFCDDDDPCSVAGTKELFDNLDIKTFVVAFGVQPHRPILPRCIGDPDETPNVNCCASESEPLCTPHDATGIPVDSWPPDPVAANNRMNRSLRCMASTGGTSNEDYDLDGAIDSEDGPGVIYPQNQDELIDALVAILDDIKPAPAVFTTAAVPSVQAEAADKIFLSEFTPIPERSTWQGKLKAFLKPLPLDDDGKPDDSRLCKPSGPHDSACLAWEAGDVILNNQITPGSPVGDLEAQRRIFYSEFNGGVPRPRHFLLPTISGVTPLAQEFDFWRGFDIDFDAGDPSTYAAARSDANDIVDFVTSVKTTPMNSDFPVPFDYVLPDIFHSDPLLLGSPDNLLYFFGDVNGYREFAIDHAFRRRVLLFGSNGGLLHGLDAGVCRTPPAGDPRICVFDNGSGRELFAHMPRTAMPTLNLSALGPVPRHRFIVDGRTQAADVFIDPLHDGAMSVTDPPDEIDREWRTILIGGLREGGNEVPEGVGDMSSPALAPPPPGPLPVNQLMSGYYALDLTLPDPLIPPPVATPNRPPVPDATLLEPPACLETSDGITPVDPACGTTAYAAALWEFTDSIEGVRLDEDDNGYVDLAFAWSNPTIGRIQVCKDPCLDPELDFDDRHVAIFGGGFDARSPFSRGNHIYILDIETGEAIYKRPVAGAIGSELAAVDTDFDGYLDRVYIPTTAGDLYRLDLGGIDHDGNPGTAVKYPEVETTTVTETPANGSDVERDVERILDPDFDPHLLLKTTDVLSEPLTVRPIFYRPSVIYLPAFNKYAVAVGTGNRDDIFRRDQPTGRFFVFVDDVTPFAIRQGSFVPFSPVHPGLTALDPDSPTRLEDTDLLQPNEGWWLELETNERLVTEPFALSGVLFFTTFVPDPDGPEVIPEGSLCREKGVSNVYGVFTSNADGLLADDDDISDPDDLVRYLTVSGLVSAPFAEQAQTKNPPPDPDDDINTSDDLTGRLKYIRDRLKLQFPENCTFPPGYRTDIKTRGSGTELSFIAPVPICVVEKSFREF